VYDGTPEVLLATVLFRWFNKTTTGETLFCQKDMITEMTPFDEYLRTGVRDVLVRPLRAQGPPWVTGAFMVKTPSGMDKLDGVVDCVDTFRRTETELFTHPDEFGHPVTSHGHWRDAAKYMADQRGLITLESAWEWAQLYPYMGKFMAYELITDLRHTYLLNQAPDVMTWANPGPGALRGAELIRAPARRVRKGRLAKSSHAEAHEVMAHLLELSRDPKYWPQEDKWTKLWSDSSYDDQLQGVVVVANWRPGDFPRWEMRDVEMLLCEMSKFERTRLGFGRPKGTYS
jgi:hypothetical protein